MKVMFVTKCTLPYSDARDLVVAMNENNDAMEKEAWENGYEVVNQSFHLTNQRSAGGNVFAAIQLFKLVKQTVIDGDETLEEADS